RISPWGWRVKEPAICGSCKDKSCVHKDYTYNSISKSCGVYLLPEKLDDNTACILCSGCMKACNKYNPEKVEGRPNPGFRYIGFAKDLLKNKTLSMAETFFVLIVSGFVIYEILSEWNGTKQILMFLPKLLKNYFDIHSPVVIGLEKSTILFLLLPLLIVFIPFLVSRLARTARVAVSFKEYLVNYSIVLIPVMAAAHISKSLLKSISRIPYFEHIPKDLTGLSTAQEILDKTIVLDKIPSWLSWSATGAVTLLLLTGFVLSIKLTAIVNKKLFEEKGTAKVFYLLPLLYSGIFLITIIAWRYF
ncbi:MAG: hypothetical protein GY754_01255, partial [bacterium]|nr:hypothetical protein [bacterium]